MTLSSLVPWAIAVASAATGEPGCPTLLWAHDLDMPTFAILDLGQDGDPDVLLSDIETGLWVLDLHSGELRWWGPTEGWGGSVGNLDGDAHPDVVAWTNGTDQGTLQVFEVQPTRFSLEFEVPIAVAAGEPQVAGDINGDGLDDVFRGPYEAWLASTDPPGVVDAALPPLADPYGDSEVFVVPVGDVDGDGFDDWIQPTWAPNGAVGGYGYTLEGPSVLRFGASEAYGERTVVIPPIDPEHVAGGPAILADVDGDGLEEIVTYSFVRSGAYFQHVVGYEVGKEGVASPAWMQEQTWRGPDDTVLLPWTRSAEDDGDAFLAATTNEVRAYSMRGGSLVEQLGRVFVPGTMSEKVKIYSRGVHVYDLDDDGVLEAFGHGIDDSARQDVLVAWLDGLAPADEAPDCPEWLPSPWPEPHIVGPVPPEPEPEPDPEPDTAAVTAPEVGGSARCTGCATPPGGAPAYWALAAVWLARRRGRPAP